jgi:hypothetical protein
MLPYLVLDQHVSLEEAKRVVTDVGLRSPDYAALALDYVHRHTSTDG